MNLIVEKEQTLLEALQFFFPDSSNTSLRSWIEEERVFVNGKIVLDPRSKVYPSQELFLGKKKRYMKADIEILYEDGDLIVLCKPAGVLSVATDFDVTENVHAFLKKRFHRRRVFPVHRLDREVSGVMVFAYNENALEGLKKQFEEHSILREYVAIVEGEFDLQEGTWSSYLYEDGLYYVRSSQDPNSGEHAITHYRVLKNQAHATSLLITLETGRKNQIRVHCKEAGHPILGDAKYGSSFKKGSRIGLHACKLGIHHPITKKPMMFKKEPPEEFLKYLPKKFKI